MLTYIALYDCILLSSSTLPAIAKYYTNAVFILYLSKVLSNTLGPISDSLSQKCAPIGNQFVNIAIVKFLKVFSL